MRYLQTQILESWNFTAERNLEDLLAKILYFTNKGIKIQNVKMTYPGSFSWLVKEPLLKHKSMTPVEYLFQ